MLETPFGRLALPPQSTLLRVVVLGGLLVADLALGYLAVRLDPQLLLLAVLIPPVALLALRYSEYGLVALLLTAAFVRASLPTGTQSRIVASLVLTAVLVALWIGRAVVLKQPLLPRRSRVIRPIVAIIVISFVSYLWSLAFRDPLVVVWRTWPIVQLGGLGVMLLLPAAFLLTFNNITAVRWVHYLFGAMIAVGICSLAVDYGHLPITFINTRGLFSLWFVALVYGQLLFNRHLRLWQQLALGLVLALWLYRKLMVETYWLAGWFPALVAMGIITFFRSKRVAVLMALVALAVLAWKWGYINDVILARESAESGVTRWAAWQQNWIVTGRHWLFGTGPAGYAAYYMTYFPKAAMATHSNYIDLLSQLGIVGLGAYLWLLGTLGFTGWRLVNRVGGRGDGVAGFACGMLGGYGGVVVAMALGDWLVPFVYTQTITGYDYAVYSWIWLGALAGLETLTAGESWPG